MTTKILTGTYASGYALKSPVTLLSITTTGYVEGTGVTTAGSPTFFSVINNGRVTSSLDGVSFQNGNVTNGSATNVAALIQGVTGVSVGTAIDGSACTVTNYGTIKGAIDKAGASGVQIDNTGQVINGSAGDTAALISGANGVYSLAPASAPANVTNFGNIVGAELYGKFAGVNAIYGGAVTNGSAADLTARIRGGYGVLAQRGAATVNNYGRIVGQGLEGDGVRLDDGGLVTNGSASDTTALIDGHSIGVVLIGPGTVDNFGSIVSDFTSYNSAVFINGGTLVNGSATDKAALIEGYKGVQILGAATNFGTIEATNGVGVYVFPFFTLTNFGTIVSLGGQAVSIGTSGNLVVEPGCVFSGSVTGTGAAGVTLDGGAGTITLSSTDNLVVTGSMARTTFSTFGVVDIDAKSSEILSGTGDVVGGKTLSVEGALATAGTLNLLANTATPANGGQLSLAGTLSGAGTLSVGAGATASFGTGASLTIGHVTVSTATSQANVTDPDLVYAGLWTQNAGTLTVASGGAITFTGAGDIFKGTLAGAGAVVLGGGSDTLSSLTADVFLTIAGAGTVTATGAITMIDEVYLDSGTLVAGVGTGGVTLTGGTLFIADSSVVTGASAASTLTNISSGIIGGGQLGDGHMRLVNDVNGLIEATSFTAPLVINTGTVGVVNQGTMASFDAGGLIIESNLSNTGFLEALGGNITAQKAVGGSGSVQIDNGATADFEFTFIQNVDFITTKFHPHPASGTLELARSQGYTGAISGFSTTGGTALDLGDIAFAVATTTATYSGTTAGGVLTVTDGTHTAHINFAGDYTASAWILSSDGHGGTTIVDPPKAASAPPPHMAPLIAAMAGFGGGAGATLSVSHGAGRFESAPLTRPA